MKDVTFFDATGEPIVYLDSEDTIYLFSGEAVAYVVDSSVYAFDGAHLGRFEDGWIRDHYGRGVFFTEEAHNEPFRPNVHHTLPKKALKMMKPRKQPREAPSLGVKPSSSWSKVSDLRFFGLDEKAQG